MKIIKTVSPPTKGYLVDPYYNCKTKTGSYKVYKLQDRDRIILNQIYHNEKSTLDEMIFLGLCDTINNILYSRIENLKVFITSRIVFEESRELKFTSKAKFGKIPTLISLGNCMLKANNYSDQIRFWKSEWGTPWSNIYGKNKPKSFDFDLPF